MCLCGSSLTELVIFESEFLKNKPYANNTWSWWSDWN